MKRVSFFLAFILTVFANPNCLYDGTKDFAYNCAKEYPRIPTFDQRPSQFTKKLFGYPIASSIGIPACAIMTSNGIEWASRAGFDILTYKTVRRHPFNGYPVPNIFVLENPDETSSFDKMITLLKESPFTADSITMANSMGIPSLSKV